MEKIIHIKTCLNCPLSEISNGNVCCHSGSVEVTNVCTIIGKVEDKLTIPDWCPLTNSKDFLEECLYHDESLVFKYYKKEILKRNKNR